MDSQDQNLPQMPSDTLSQTPSVPPSSILSPPLLSAAAPSYSAQHVRTDGDITAVPQEQIGFQADEMLPQPADRLTAPAEVFAEASAAVPLGGKPSSGPAAAPVSPPQIEPAISDERVSELPTTPLSETSVPEMLTQMPAVPEAAPDEAVQTAADGAQPSSDPTGPNADAASAPEKTPLEILEEILASANEGAPGAASEGEATPSPEDVATEEAKRQQAEKEAQEAAARAAEEQRYRQEADQRIALAQQDLQQAAQQREEVTQELQSQGKQVGPTQEAPQDDQFAIAQLKHDTLSKNNN
jgi:hypothetical protein